MFIESILFNIDQIVMFAKPVFGLFISWSGTGNLASVISYREK